jgi:hypothetical protein
MSPLPFAAGLLAEVGKRAQKTRCVKVDQSQLQPVTRWGPLDAGPLVALADAGR